MNPEDFVIEEFLEGQPRADTWKELRETLAIRLQDVVRERDSLPDDDPARAGLERKARDLQAQVEALAQEEAVTRFVEDSVRASLSGPAMSPAYDEDEFE